MKYKKLNVIQQSGLSLIELMIAMATSVTLLAGVIQLAISNKDIYNFRHSQSITQENTRFAYHFADQVLAKAGYVSAPQTPRGSMFPFASATTQCAAFKIGQIISNSLEGTGLCIRYQREKSTDTDCLGNNITSSNAIVTRLFFDSSTNSLKCGAQNVAAAELVQHIENMLFIYGISNDTAEVGRSINAYVSTPNEWENIVSIQIATLTSSDMQTRNVSPPYYFPLNTTTATPAADKRLYSSSVKTVTLRNATL